MAERITYYGISSNLVTYLTGPLGLTTAAAAANVNVWTGTAMLSSLIGAFIADSFWGRYKTILIASLLYVLGLGFLTLSATFQLFNTNDVNNTMLQMILFFFPLYLVALAQGGFKPCLQAFGADQFDEEDFEESKAKASFFNWWNFSLCASVVPSLFVLNYIQENISWELGFGIPAIVMCIALIIFVLGTATYRFRISSEQRNNPFVRIGTVFVKAATNWKATPSPRALSIEEEVSRIVPRDVDRFRFLDKALAIEEHGKFCSIDDVDDAKAILRLVPLWFTCLGYAIAYSQPSTMFTKQGATMDRRITSAFQIPVGSLHLIINVSIFTLIPIYDLILVPIARFITKKPYGVSMLQRIGIGLFLCLISMVIAALVERKRISIAIKYGLVDFPNGTVPMSVWWLTPQYIFLGISDVFTLVGLQEFFYDQVPSELKSVGIALCVSVGGIGNFLSSFLVSFINNATSGNGEDGWFSDNLNRAHIDYFYWVLAAVNAVALCAYVYFAKSYVYNTRKVA